VDGWIGDVAAVLECWLGGQAVGGAVADLLLGAANPCGRLAETLPLRLEDSPSFLNFPGEAGPVRYGEGVFVGYRGYDAVDRRVSFPFGHGLSYTTFDYSGLDVAVTGGVVTGDLAVRVDVEVTNTGPRSGKEVVQVYVGDPQAAVARPVRELRAFAKVGLEPGEPDRRPHPGCPYFSYWSTRHGGWLLEPGEFEIAVGSSSVDLRLTTTVHLDGPVPRLPLDGRSTLQEWLADPDGGPALLAAVATGPGGRGGSSPTRS
jgi:beta-glucosidase